VQSSFQWVKNIYKKQAHLKYGVLVLFLTTPLTTLFGKSSPIFTDFHGSFVLKRQNKKTLKSLIYQGFKAFELVAERGFEPPDLRVMRVAIYHPNPLCIKG
jgi:hypothetical protein